MSAFICSANHYGTISKTLYGFATNNQLSDAVWPLTQKAMPGKTVYSFGVDDYAYMRKFISAMVLMMYKLNVETFGEKYGEDMAQEYARKQFSPMSGTELHDPAALYKALTCWRYQTIYEIGYILEKRVLKEDEKQCIELVEKIISHLAEKIATQTAAYDRAPWGIN